MSGYADRGVSRRRGFEAGAAFLEKPFTPLLLATKVRAVLDEGGEPPPATSAP